MIQTIIEVMPDEQRASVATMNRQFKRILGHSEPKGFAEWLVASADWREKCLKKLVRVTADENKTVYKGVV